MTLIGLVKKNLNIDFDTNHFYIFANFRRFVDNFLKKAEISKKDESTAWSHAWLSLRTTSNLPSLKIVLNVSQATSKSFLRV